MSEVKITETKIRRNTPQRKIILEELCAVKSHPTAAELYDMVRQRMPRVSLGTVYRNLEVLHEDGMIRKLEFAGAETRFDGDTQEHYHVRCRDCGHIQDIYDLGPGGKPAQPTELAGYRIEGHRLEYFGICPDCQPTAARENTATN
ncbi:MAG: transcriptional repressor [Candidatus Krumholzibacteria bacterium]|nr:transcriptional repressor [Candidatus Krumholzibacteria bacterium]